eukprot:2764385-Alexandrium_andersonii.AAC.1
MDLLLEVNTVLQRCVYRHRNVPMCLGAKAIGLLDKMQARLYQIYVETSDLECFVGHLRSVNWFCTDHGTEFSLGEAPMLDIKHMFSNFLPLEPIVSEPC